MLRVFPRVAIGLLAVSAAFAQTPAVSESGVVNSVTLDRTQAIAAGSIVSIFGTELAASSAMADSAPLSTSIAGVTVTFNNIPAGIRQVSPTLISVQVPWDVQGDSASVVVTRNGVASSARNVQVAQYSPGVFAIQGLAPSNLALALNSDGTLAQATGLIAGLNSHPAKFGDTVTILATGLGPVDGTPPANGAAAKDAVLNVLTMPQVMLGGIGAQVNAATLASNFVGAYQVQITVPDAAPANNSVAVQLQVGGFSSPNTTTMAITAN